jgi:hypothetical protein
MTPVIQQSVRFRTTPQALFDPYMDSTMHSRSTGAAARISRKVGGKFTAFGRQLEGKNLHLVPGNTLEEGRLVYSRVELQWCCRRRPG